MVTFGVIFHNLHQNYSENKRSIDHPLMTSLSVIKPKSHVFITSQLKLMYC